MAKEKSSNNFSVSSKNKIYKSLYVRTSNKEKMIVGVPMEFDHESEDTSLIIDNQIPYVDVENYYERLLQLPSEKRSVIDDIISYALENGKATIHMGKNLEMLFNYIYSREGLSISNILVDTYNIIDKNSDLGSDNELLTSKITNYNKMCKTATFKEYNMLLVGLICAYNFISPSFIKNGKGYMYIFTETLPEDKLQSSNEIIKKYLYDQYNNNNKNNHINMSTDFDNIYDMEYCLDNLVGVKGKYKKVEIQCMYKFIHLEKYFNGLINTLLDKK